MSKEIAKPVGMFSLKVYKHGKLIQDITEKNLIVDNGLLFLTAFLATGNSSFIDKIGFGTNATAPAPGDTTLTNEYLKPVSASQPTTGKVQFDWALETYENNGVTITEYGLKMDTGDIFSRKTFASIAKDNTIRLTGTWSIQF